MLRLMRVPSMRIAVNSTFVTVAKQHRRKFEIIFPSQVMMEEKLKIINHLKQLVQFGNKLQFDFNTFLDPPEESFSKIELIVSGEYMGNIHLEDIDKLIKNSLSTKMISSLSEDVAIHDEISDTNVIQINEFHDSKHKKSNCPPQTITARKILEDINKYPNCAIPRRNHLDKNKWRLRNMFRLGIN